jgi:hypothetical protein
MRRVSSLVSGRAAPAGDNFPLISTSGGFPGEKNRSLTFSEVLSIAVSKSFVEIRAGAAAAAAALVPAPADGCGDGEATGVGRFGIRFVGVDIMGRVCSRYLCFRDPGFSLFPVRWFVEVSGRRGLLAEVLTHCCIVQRLRNLPARHSMRFHYQGHFRRERRGKMPCLTAALLPENSRAGALAR